MTMDETNFGNQTQISSKEAIFTDPWRAIMAGRGYGGGGGGRGGHYGSSYNDTTSGGQVSRERYYHLFLWRRII
jgi:hypothetical protein